MKMTVGSLPPAVYWRRRAIVLGVLLVVAMLLWASCGGNSKDAKHNAANTASNTPLAASSPTSTQTPSLGPTLLFPTTPGVTNSASATPGTPLQPAPDPSGLLECADANLSLIAEPKPATGPNGAYMVFYIKIKNTSGVPCKRDLGADHQELYLQSGTTKVWSSDVCNPAHGAETVTMAPNIEHSYNTTWNGKASNNGCDNRQPPGIGKYELFARLDTKISEPVTVQLT